MSYLNEAITPAIEPTINEATKYHKIIVNMVKSSLNKLIIAQNKRSKF